MRERLRDRGSVGVLALAVGALLLLTATIMDTGGDEDIDLVFGFWMLVAVALLGVVSVHAARALRLPKSSERAGQD